MPTQTIEVLRIPGTLFPRGAFDENADYKFLNIVESGGSGYVCLQPCTGIPVTNTAYWFKFCFKGEKGDAFTYADLTAAQKAELVRDATAAAQAAASSAQSAADDAAAVLQKFNTIKAAIDAIDPQSTEGSIQTLAAKQGLLEADLNALGPKIEQVAVKDENGEAQPSPFSIIQNPEYILAVVDANDKLLFGIKYNGEVEWGDGVPSPIKVFLQEHYQSKLSVSQIESIASIADKVDKVTGKGLSANDFTDALKSVLDKLVGKVDIVSDDEYIYAITDGAEKVLFGVKANGDVYLSSIFVSSKMLESIGNALKDGGYIVGAELKPLIEANSTAIAELNGRIATNTANIAEVKEETLYAADAMVTRKIGSMDGTSFSQAFWDRISQASGGTVNNAADGEDLANATEGGVSVIKFANKVNGGQGGGTGVHILRRNFVDGVNTLDVGNNSPINNVTDTTFIVKYDFDLGGETLVIGERSTLSFEGGSIRNGNIVLDKTNTIVSREHQQCFYDVLLSGAYHKVFPLYLIGIIDDGTDKYSELSAIPDIFYGLINTGTNASQRIVCSIEGVIRCDTNGIHIPSKMSLVGNEGRTAELYFTSSIGDYCMSISSDSVLSGLTIRTANNGFSGAIVKASTLIYDLSKNIYGASNFRIENCLISSYATGDTRQATGISLVASTDSETKLVQPYSAGNAVSFTNCVIDKCEIRNVKYGIDVSVDNATNSFVGEDSDYFAWGNEIHSSILFISARCVGIRMSYRSDYQNNSSSLGFCSFGCYEFQRILTAEDGTNVSAAAFNISGNKGAVDFSSLRSWDTPIIGIIGNNGVVRVAGDYLNGNVTSVQMTDDDIYRRYDEAESLYGLSYKKTSLAGGGASYRVYGGGTLLRLVANIIN